MKTMHGRLMQITAATTTIQPDGHGLRVLWLETGAERRMVSRRQSSRIPLPLPRRSDTAVQALHFQAQRQQLPQLPLALASAEPDWGTHA
jgi:hypothetical protein